MDNVLDYMDETFFLDFRTQGHGPVIQFTWIYEREIDLDGLRRFQRNLAGGLLSRRIERSPLPFGRPRWIAWTGTGDLNVAAEAIQRSEIATWTHEQAALVIDPEGGPPCRLLVQPLVGSGAVVTLLAAHAVVDGGGMAAAVADAVRGVTADLGYPGPHSRTKTQAMLGDARELMRELPKVAKALISLPFVAKEIQRQMRPRAGRPAGLARRGETSAALARRNMVADLARVVIPSVTVRIDCRHWDERAEALGGTSNSMFLGVASRLCAALGWVDAYDVSSLTIPVSQRKPGDTRGNALTSVELSVDTSNTPSDLRDLRAGIKTALSTLGASRDLIEAPLPLIPFVPKFASRKSQDVLLGSANVTCSNLGDLDPAVNRPDGTDADQFSVRFMRYAGVLTEAFVKEAGGLFFPMVSGRVHGNLFITISYVDAGASTTTDELTEVVRWALHDLGLTAIIE